MPTIGPGGFGTGFVPRPPAAPYNPQATGFGQVDVSGNQLPGAGTPRVGVTPGPLPPPPSNSGQPTGAAPSGGSGSSGGGSPSGPSPSPWMTDPGYLAAVAAQQQGVEQLRAQLNNQIAQAIIQYGDPTLAAQAGFGLDNQSAAFARQNYLSGNATKARLDKANQDALTAIVNKLAGSGLLFSGDYGYDNQQQATNYANQVYDAQQAVLNAIAGYRSNELSGEQSLQQSVVQALEQAYTNFVNQQIAGGGSGGGGSSSSSSAASAASTNPTSPATSKASPVVKAALNTINRTPSTPVATLKNTKAPKYAAGGRI